MNNLKLLASIICLLTIIGGSYVQGQGTCCCGNPKLIDFQGLDFEFDPYPAPAGYIPYTAGSSFGPWIVTQGAVDHGDKDYCGILAAGNPNGASAFVDLFGSPFTGSIAGTMLYPLTGLTPGYIYTIEFWYATFTANGSFSANLKIANGAWLDVSWNANNPGSAVWLKKSYSFTANATSATLTLKDTGPSSPTYQIGMLMDDIKIYECAVDLEKPIVENPQDDLEVACEKDVPKAATLIITDNCDANPQVTLKETKENHGPCNKKLIRDWTVKDACGNLTEETQVIDIVDKSPPQFTNLPINKTVYCTEDVLKEFNDWVSKKGQSTAADDCGNVSWKTSFERTPHNFCDSVKVEFTALDDCGLENSENAYFIVLDTVSPRFTIKPQNKNLICVSAIRDSLYLWLSNYGYSNTFSGCDTGRLSHNFDGDSTKNPMLVTFYVRDPCGHVDSSTATFSYRNASDTVRIKSYSCAYPANTLDTIKYTVQACDSVVILEKIKLDSDSTFIKQYTCDPKQKLSDTLRLVNMNGCDSLIYYQYVLQPTPHTVIKDFDCALLKYSSDTLIWAGQYCDSVVIIEHIPLQKDSTFIQAVSCDSLKVGLTIDHFLNRFGCDSFVIQNTFFVPQQTTRITVRECGLLNEYVDTLKFTTALCDSFVIVYHLAIPKDSIVVNSSTCDPLIAGQYSHRFTNQYGCDSLVIELISLKPSDSVFLEEKTCVFSSAGKRVLKFSNQFGCDSLVQIDIKFIPSDTLWSIQYTCDLKEVGIDTVVYTTNTCDSILFLEKKYKSADTSFTSQFTCNILDSGMDTLLHQNQYGCDSLVFVHTIFKPLQLNYKLDSIQCFDQNNGKIFIINDSIFTIPYEFYLNQKIFTNINRLENLAPGNYEVYVKDGDGCITDSVRFTLLNPSEFITELGPDKDVERGTRVEIKLQSNKRLVSIYWKPDKYSNCTICDQLNFIADQDGWIYSLSLDEQNCSSFDSVYIRVKESEIFYVPNLISPNGDNINDYFFIQGPENGSVENLVIYDRWGAKVFGCNGVPVNQPNVGWDGTYHSQPLNPGVFVFYVRLRTDKGIVEMSGDFTLVR